MERAASEMDPFARPWAIGSMLLLARRYDAALEDLLEKQKGDPANVNVLEVIMDTYACMGRYQQYAASFATWLELTGRRAAGAQVRAAFARGGHTAVLEWELRDLKSRSASQYVSPVDFAAIEAALGRREEAPDVPGSWSRATLAVSSLGPGQPRILTSSTQTRAIGR